MHWGGLIWVLGASFLLLKFPVQTYRYLTGREATPRVLKIARVLGYWGVLSVSVWLIEVAFGWVH